MSSGDLVGYRGAARRGCGSGGVSPPPVRRGPAQRGDRRPGLRRLFGEPRRDPRAQRRALARRLDEATDLDQARDHWADHRARRAFTFTLLTPARDAGLGCLYLNPLRDYLRRAGAAAETVDEFPAASAMVTFWLRQDQEGTGLAEAFVDALVPWLRDEWPLDRWLVRVRPEERDSCAALAASRLTAVALDLPREPRQYRWYGLRVG